MTEHANDREALNVWRSQATQGVSIPVDEIRKRVALSASKTRRQRLIVRGAATAGLIAAIANFLLGDSLLRVWFYIVGVVSYVVLLVQLPWMAAETLNSQQPITLQLSARSLSCLDCYRKEMELRRESFRQFRVGMAILALFGLLLLLFGSDRPWIAVPLGLSMMSAAAVWYYRKRREVPEIELEIEELDAFRRNQA